MPTKLVEATLIHYFRKLVLRLDLVGQCARFNTPMLCAFLIRLLSRRIDRNSEHEVICLTRPIFEEDIAALAANSGTLNYLLVPKTVFISIMRIFTPDLLLDHAGYHETDRFTPQKQACRDFYGRLLGVLNARGRVSAIVTANYNYSWQQEFCAAATEMEIPVLVYFKEGISPVHAGSGDAAAPHEAVIRKFTNNNFIGDRLLVYNDLVRKAFVRSGIRGISSGNVETVGIARLDRYFKLETLGSDVLFFSFSFEDKAGHVGLTDAEMQKYLDKTLEFHAEVIRFAAQNPSERVLIKTKSNPKFLQYVRGIADDIGCGHLPNLVTTNEGDVYELIRNAKAVIGYNSTSLLEGYAARRVVMSADFRWGKVRDFYFDYPDLPNLVSSAADIAKVLSMPQSRYPLDHPELVSMLQYRIHTPDGNASKRVEAAIRLSIGKHHHALPDL